MKTKKNHKLTLMALVMTFLLAVTLSGCGSQNAAEEPKPVLEPIPDGETQPAAAEAEVPSGNAESSSDAEAKSDSAQAETTVETDNTAAEEPSSEAETPAADTRISREDGERFEDVIMIEGMEEPVHYEHFINAGIGVEMDYDYESFVRQSSSDLERFISVYDDAQNPENYLDITYSPDDAETAADAISETLSKDYELIRESFDLNNAGTCIRIGASEIKGGGYMPDQLHMVYIIPAADGCRIAHEHYYIVESEGFGRRFSSMVNTLIVIDRQAE